MVPATPSCFLTGIRIDTCRVSKMCIPHTAHNHQRLHRLRRPLHLHRLQQNHVQRNQARGTRTWNKFGMDTRANPESKISARHSIGNVIVMGSANGSTLTNRTTRNMEVERAGARRETVPVKIILQGLETHQATPGALMLRKDPARIRASPVRKALVLR